MAFAGIQANNRERHARFSGPLKRAVVALAYLRGSKRVMPIRVRCGDMGAGVVDERAGGSERLSCAVSHEMLRMLSMPAHTY